MVDEEALKVLVGDSEQYPTLTSTQEPKKGLSNPYGKGQGSKLCPHDTKVIDHV